MKKRDYLFLKYKEWKNKMDKKREEKEIRALVEDVMNDSSSNKIFEFKKELKKMVNSVKSKVVNGYDFVVGKVNFTNFDLKVRNGLGKLQNKALSGLNIGVKKMVGVKEKVVLYKEEKLQKYNNWKNELKETYDKKAVERLAKKVIHEEQKEQLKKEKEEKILNFKEDVIQKTDSVKSKMGNVSNSVLVKVKQTNIDVKLRNAFEKAQISGLNVLNKGMVSLNNTKNNIDKFTSEQIYKYVLWKMEMEERQEERSRQKRIREAEILELKSIRARAKEHRDAMIEIINQQERNEYDAKYEELINQKQELLQALRLERSNLFNSSSELIKVKKLFK